MSMRPPESVLMRSATRSADMPGPGRRFGHDVTIFHFTVWARAIEGIAIAPKAPVTTAVRRVILVMGSSPESVEMMQRPVALADL
jgi:hypothetical protein